MMNLRVTKWKQLLLQQLTRKTICAGQTPIIGHPPIVIGLTYVNWDFWTFRGIMVASNKTRQCGTSEPVAFFVEGLSFNQMKTTFVTTFNRKFALGKHQLRTSSHWSDIHKLGFLYIWGIMVLSNKTRQCGTSEPVAFFLLNIFYVWRKMTCFTMYFHYPKLLSQPLFCEFV